MTSIVSRLVMTTAAAGMALAPIAASANTRAGDSATTYSVPASAPGKGRAAKGEKLVAPGILIAVLAGAAAIGAIVIINDDDDEDNQSPGGN